MAKRDMEIAYQSYCWTMGTTSFRPAELNRSIEEQLRLLRDFRDSPESAGGDWRSLQEAYYEHLKAEGFLSGDAKDPAKDARQKASGLGELGLVDGEKRLTAAGSRLLEVVEAGDFSPDESNLFGVSRDSWLYFLQLLKAKKSSKGWTVRPFVVFLRLMADVPPDSDGRRRLSAEEFRYLLPVCTDEKAYSSILDCLKKKRGEDGSVGMEAIDETIRSVLMDMDNYRDALDLFLRQPSVDKDLIRIVGMNRKSKKEDADRKYDEKLHPIFLHLRKLAAEGVSEAEAAELAGAVKRIKNEKISAHWKKTLFRVPDGARFSKPFAAKWKPEGWDADETAFRKRFFETMHLIKAKATLEDYGDLNRRYFSLSDCALFRKDGGVELAPLPAAFAEDTADWLAKASFSDCSSLENADSLEDIVEPGVPEKERLVELATGLTPDEVAKRGGVDAFLESKRQEGFSNLLKTRFTKTEVGRLLAMMENRTKKNDEAIRQSVTKDADIPTIFEYLVAIAWHYVSGGRGDVAAFANLSLDPGFLPKTHAGGGKADIVWKYADNPPHYGKHALLIEATLSEKDTQRRMEMEPVSRHLGEYLLNHADDKGAYCVFVSTHLNLNVVSDFRGRKTMLFYSDDGQSAVRGMKIVPLDTALLRTLLDSGVSYSDLHGVFERLFQMEREPREWFDELRRELESFRRTAPAEPLVP
ncbi:MAG: AlwI family type II restriction endonuclease [Kiritimatiellae bacterium]|nr:AlwI family type II restriction endonuclease [Kiritimatiellia bacterium]